VRQDKHDLRAHSWQQLIRHSLTPNLYWELCRSGVYVAHSRPRALRPRAHFYLHWNNFGVLLRPSLIKMEGRFMSVEVLFMGQRGSVQKWQAVHRGGIFTEESRRQHSKIKWLLDDPKLRSRFEEYVLKNGIKKASATCLYLCLYFYLYFSFQPLSTSLPRLSLSLSLSLFLAQCFPHLSTVVSVKRASSFAPRRAR
jgi:hypothetical protein